MTSAGAILTIDLGAIRRNYRILRERLLDATLAAVVKADAYGLGVAEVASALAREGCRTFFVATADEGFALRSILIGAGLPDADIHVFNGIQPGEAAEFTEQRILPVLNSLEQMAIWREYALAHAPRDGGKGFAADLHIDTGMSRLGLDAAEQKRLLARPDHLTGIDLDVVVSHLAVAEDAANPMNESQRAAFAEVAGGLPGRRKSLVNSSGIFLGPRFHFDLARSGVALYGVNPSPGQSNPMAQVVGLQGRILQVRFVDTHRSVGYGATHRASRPSRIATVAIGYADGYPLSLSNVGIAYIDGREVPVVRVPALHRSHADGS